LELFVFIPPRKCTRRPVPGKDPIELIRKLQGEKGKQRLLKD
jgi:hypothetical protein